MKKFAILILVLALLCGVLAGCGNGRGNVSDRKDGLVTDSPNDADDIMERDGMTDNDKNKVNTGDKSTDKKNDKKSDEGSVNDTSPSMTPSGSPDITQPIAP